MATSGDRPREVANALSREITHAISQHLSTGGTTPPAASDRERSGPLWAGPSHREMAGGSVFGKYVQFEGTSNRWHSWTLLTISC